MQEKNKKIFIGGVGPITTPDTVKNAFENLSVVSLTFLIGHTSSKYFVQNSKEGMPLTIKVHQVDLKKDGTNDDRNRGL